MGAYLLVVNFSIYSLEPMGFQGSNGLLLWTKLPIMIQGVLTASLVGITLPVCLVFHLSRLWPIHLVSAVQTLDQDFWPNTAPCSANFSNSNYCQQSVEKDKNSDANLSESVLPALWFTVLVLRSCINVSSISNCYYLYKNINSTFNHQFSNGYWYVAM